MILKGSTLLERQAWNSKKSGGVNLGTWRWGCRQSSAFGREEERKEAIARGTGEG